MSRLRNVGYVVVGAAIATAAMGSFSYASIPDNDGIINTCVSGTGSLRVIDTAAGSTCDTAGGETLQKLISSSLQVHQVATNPISVPKNQDGSTHVSCPPGEIILGGGFGGGFGMTFTSSVRDEDSQSWQVSVHNGNTATAINYIAFAECMKL